MKHSIHASRFFFACLIAFLVMGGQFLNAQTAKSDSLPPVQSGLRLISFDLETDNFSGFDDGSEKKLRKSVVELRDALPVDSQALFLGYDLGLYRLTDDKNAKTEAETKLYVDEAASKSKYYIILVKIWSGQQKLEDLRVYFNLPKILPIFYLMSDKQAQLLAGELIKKEYDELSKNPAQVKKAQARGVSELIKNLTDLGDAVAFDTSGTIQGDFVGLTADRFGGNDNDTYVTPSGLYIKIPYGSLIFYKKCTTTNSNKGTLIKFNYNSKNYYGWYKASTRDFIGYAPKTSDSKLDYASIYQPDSEPDDVLANIGYFEDGNFNQHTGKLNTAVPYVLNDPSPLYTPLEYTDLTLVSSTVDNSGCLAFLDETLPFFVAKDIPQEIKDGNGTPDQEQPLDANKSFGADISIIDYTGKASTLKTAMLNILGGVGIDIIITNTTFINAKLENKIYINNLRDFHPKFRCILWIHLDENLNQVRYETILSQKILSHKDGALCNKLINNFIEDIKKNPDIDVINIVVRFSGAIIGGFQTILNYGRLDARIYDCSLPNYILREVNFGEAPPCQSCFQKEVNTSSVQNDDGSLPDFDFANIDPEDALKLGLAAGAGTWNGVVDFAAGAAFLLEMGPKIWLSVFYPDDRKETIDNFNKIKSYVKTELIGDLKAEALKLYDCPNQTLIPYYICYTAASVGVGKITSVEALATKGANGVWKTVNLSKIAKLFKEPLGKDLVQYFAKGGFVFESDANDILKVTRRVVDANGTVTLESVLGYVNKEGRFVFETSSIVDFKSSWKISEAFPCEAVKNGVVVDVIVYEVIDEFGVKLVVLCEDLAGLAAKVATKIGVSISEYQSILIQVLKECKPASWLVDDAVLAKIKSLEASQKKIFLKDLVQTKGFGSELTKITENKLITCVEFIEGWSKLASSNCPEIFRRDFELVSSAAILTKHNLFQNMGGASFGDFALIHRFTHSGDFINAFTKVRKPYGIGFFELSESLESDFNRKYWKDIESAFEKLSTTNRLRNSGYVFRGVNMAKDEFDALFTAPGAIGDIPIKGIISTSELQGLAEAFITKYNLNVPNSVKVIYKIKPKLGIYVDDFSEWGTKLGPIYHTTLEDLPIQIQREVILKEGLFKIVPNSLKPYPFKIKNIDTYEVELIELGVKFRNF